MIDGDPEVLSFPRRARPDLAYVSEIDSRHRILLCFHSIGQVAKCSDYRVSKSTDTGLKILPDHRNDLVAIASDKYPFPFGLNRFIRFLKLDHHGFEFTSVGRGAGLLGKFIRQYRSSCSPKLADPKPAASDPSFQTVFAGSGHNCRNYRRAVPKTLLSSPS
jgi:hypothetical protein